jgi:hypothetical protein
MSNEAGDRIRPPNSWSEIVGSVCHRDSLPKEVSEASGLIVLETKDGTLVCPIKQFDDHENGRVLNPHVSAAWQLMSDLHIRQLSEDPWTVAARLFATRHQDVKPWFDRLKEAASEDEINKVLADIVDDAQIAARLQGIDLETD